MGGAGEVVEAAVGDEAATCTGGLPGVSGMTRLVLPVLEMIGVDGAELAKTTSFRLSPWSFWRLVGGGVCCAIATKGRNVSLLNQVDEGAASFPWVGVDSMGCKRENSRVQKFCSKVF